MPATPDGPGRLRYRMESAAELLRSGQVDEADASYEAVLALSPGHASAQVGRGQCARRRGDVAGALAWFRSACASDPAFVWARLEYGHVLREQARWEEAAVEYGQVLALSPDLVPGLVGLAFCLRQQGDASASLGLHRRVLAADAAHVWARLQAAHDLLALDRVEEAEAEFHQVLAAAPAQQGALLGLGQCARRRGDRAMSLEWHRRAAAGDPAHAWCKLACADDLRELSRLEESRAVLVALLAARPDDVAALLSLGHSERQAGRHEAALAAFARAQALQPDSAERLLLMAMEERALGRQASCDALLAQAMTAEPGNAAVLVSLAEQACMKGDVPRMHALFAEAVARGPALLAANLGYAESLALLGRGQEALDHLAAFEPACAQAAPIRARRVNLLHRLGRWREALALAREATAEMPWAFSCWVERLLCEFSLGSDADVDECLLHAPAGNARERARLARLRARADEDRGATAAAIAGYEEATRLDPDSAEGHLALTRLHLSLLDLSGAGICLREAVRANALSTRLRGRSLNPSQTHFGQVLDEIALDGATVSQLLTLRERPLPDRIDAILDVVSACPDSTAAAMALMHALREYAPAGVPAEMAVHTPQIPLVVAQLWSGSDSPGDVREMMGSWREMNPDYRFRVFDSASAQGFVTQIYGRSAGEAFASITDAAQKADVFRLAYLAAEGGVYAGSDSRCHDALRTIIPAGARLVACQEDIGVLGTTFLAASPRHPALHRALGLALMSVARGDRDVPWLSTGPGLLTRAFAQSLAAAGGDWRSRLATTAILRSQELYRAVAPGCLAANYASV